MPTLLESQADEAPQSPEWHSEMRTKYAVDDDTILALANKFLQATTVDLSVVRDCLSTQEWDRLIQASRRLLEATDVFMCPKLRGLAGELVTQAKQRAPSSVEATCG